MRTMQTRAAGLAAVVALTLSFSFSPVALAAPTPSSDLLLPYFEVDLDGGGLTTLFSVVNSSNQPVPIVLGVHSNWGIEVLQVPLLLDPKEARSVNLRDWIVAGALPDGIQLDAAEIAHLQAALCGEESPQDGLFYSTEIQTRLAVGYVTIRVHASPRPDVLFGDFFVVDPRDNFAQGERLINIDPLDGCGNGLCDRHALRFLEGGGFDGGTELIVWTPETISPETGPILGSMASVSLDTDAYEEPGVFLGQRTVRTLPVQVVRVADLALEENFGWLELITEGPSFIGVRYSADERFSVGLVSTCLPVVDPPGPGLRIEKSTNGVDADRKPGVSIAVGDPVVWEYVVTNTGDVPITGIEVSDDDDSLKVVCPRTRLEPGEAMICTAEGEARACEYVNLGTARGTADGFGPVGDNDLSHYFGTQPASIALDLTVNGKQAKEPPGLAVNAGDELRFAYRVTNDGAAPLSGIVLLDGEGKEVSCPRDALAPGESMTCRSTGKAGAGNHEVVAKVRGKDECGVDVRASDRVFVACDCIEPPPAIAIEKATNGHDADSWATAPLVKAGDAIAWTYVVTNSGETPLHDVEVSDDDASLSLSCPKTALDPGESMTCTAHGTAGDHDYQNIGLVTALSRCDAAVVASDPSRYKVVKKPECPLIPPPGLSIRTAVNGHDANAAPGPSVAEGSTLAWTYLVKNTGDTTLFDLAVSDSLGLPILCPKSSLAEGASMTCTASSIAAEGTHSNRGRVRGNASNDPDCPHELEAEDPAWYTGNAICDDTVRAKLEVETKVNGHDADSSPGIKVDPGSTLQWSYRVKNAGNAKLFDVVVSDSLGSSISCPKSALEAGESMTCTAQSTAVEGVHENVGQASGQTGGEPECRKRANASDPAWYHAEKDEPPGGQGCTPGYWKNHTDSWPPTGYAPGQSVKSVFANAAAYPAVGNATLHQALSFGGGPSVEDAARILMRAAVAGLLDAAHPGVAYPRTTAGLIADVNAALASGDRDTMLALANGIDRDNNLGCPLN